MSAKFRVFVSIGFTIATLLGIFLSVPAMQAQSTTDGAIGGTVVDASGAVLAGAKISVRKQRHECSAGRYDRRKRIFPRK
jgi:hypothetical protein